MNSAAMKGLDKKPERKEPITMLKRVGSTIYKVNVHFGKGENLEDRLLRLMTQEVKDIA